MSTTAAKDKKYPTGTLQRRAFALHLDPETKDAGEEPGTLSGYGSVFDVVDWYGESIQKGAFKNSLAEWKAKGSSPSMLWQHDMHEPIGKWTELAEDDKGLRVKGNILVGAGPLERRAFEHAKAGTLGGLSIGYMVPDGGVHYDSRQGVWLISEVDLWEISLVTIPANDEATIDSVKSALGSPKFFERFLRDAGLSRSQAKGLMAGGYKAIASQRDADDEGQDDATNEVIEAAAALQTLTKLFLEK